MQYFKVSKKSVVFLSALDQTEIAVIATVTNLIELTSKHNSYSLLRTHVFVAGMGLKGTAPDLRIPQLQ